MTGKLTDEQRHSFRDHPEYSEGFFDALSGEPIFDDATDPYRAGWEAYWVCCEIFERNGFKQQPDRSFGKTFTAGRRAIAKEVERG